MRQGGRAHTDGQPRRVGWPQQVLGVGYREQLGRVDGPVDAVHDHRGVRGDLLAERRDVALRVLVVLLGVEAAVLFAFEVVTTAYLTRVDLRRVCN